VLAGGDPTPETLAAAITKFYGDKAEPVLKAYAATTTDEVFEAAMHLASARFISYGTWKWTELHMQTSGKPVYRYLYAKIGPRISGCRASRRRLPHPGEAARRPAGAARNRCRRLAARRTLPKSSTPWATWISTSATRGSPPTTKFRNHAGDFVNFIKTGNPAGPGLPPWPAYKPETNYQRMRIDVTSQAEPEPHRDRYLALDAVIGR